MSSTVPPTSAPDLSYPGNPAAGRWQIPPLDQDRRIIGGVGAGIAREIGIAPVHVRVSFVVLTFVAGIGALLYLLCWPIMRSQASTARTYVPVPKGRNARMRHLGFAMLVLGLLALLTSLGPVFRPEVVWPVALVGAAVALALDQGYLDRSSFEDFGGSTHLRYRFAAGAALLVSGIIAAVALNFSFWQAARSIAIAGLIAGGLGLLLAPLLTRTAEELFAERRRRIRSEERADMAAHLHDSVLQTLALIQKRSDDVGVTNLARRQERELRSWLFEEQSGQEALGFRMTLRNQLAEVEDLYEVPIEVIVVGDRPSDEATAAILGASREAATNAARHSGSARIDVYAEVQSGRIEVFVRDHGVGFDPDEIPDDRAGIRDSIRTRMQRAGGDVTIFSKQGSGTEVELSVPLDTVPDERVLPAEDPPDARAGDAAAHETAGPDKGPEDSNA